MPLPQPPTEKIQDGAKKVIDTCLSLIPGQEVAILFDETTQEVAEILLQAARQVEVQATAVFVPVSLQQMYREGANLPLATESALRASNGILTCLTDAQECQAFRRKALQAGQGHRIKIGHMPGVMQEWLAMADADYKQISADCDLLALALLRGEQLELTTFDARGRDYHLVVSVGGWERSPVISSGLIPRGGWGNIPPGETFIAPLEGTGQGSVVINGSLPGYVIPQGAEAILEFEDGRLVEYHALEARSLHILAELETYASQKRDPNWDNLAEIGLGTNPAVAALTGIEILDEKKYGSAHIALGSNDWFGGQVASDIHSDLTILNPEVRVDGRLVVGGGLIQVDPTDWQEDHRELAVEADWRASFGRVARSGIAMELRSGSLLREWRSGRGDIEHLAVGAPASAQKAARLYSRIPRVGADITVQELFARFKDLEARELYQLVRLLELYELVKLS